MSWEIKRNEGIDVVILDREMCIQNAAEFYQAVLPLAGSTRPVRVDAAATRSLHTSILQILYALSQSVTDFGVASSSEEFRAAEVRVGYSLLRSTDTGTSDNGSGNGAALYG
jgi:anti-anti-sigma regulatory factor